MALHPNVKYLTWFNFTVDFTLYAPIAVIYFSQIAGSYALGLSVFSVEMISSSIFELPTGVLSDYFGRRKTVIYGAVCGLLAGIFYALGLNYWFLFIAALFSGLGRSFHSGNNAALLHESLQERNQEQEYVKYSGSTSSMFQLALAISALIGGVISFWSLSLAVWLTVIPRLLGVFISFKLVEPKVVDSRSLTNVFAHLKEALNNFRVNEKLRNLSIASILDYGIGETIHQFKSAFLNTLWPIWAIGISGTLTHLLATFGFRLSSLITTKFGYVKTLLAGSILSKAISLTAILMANVFTPLIMPLTSLIYGFKSVALDTLFQSHFSNRQRATMGSLNSLAGSLFFGVFAFAFGLIADQINPRQAMLVGEILTLSVVFLYWRMFHKEKVSKPQFITT